MNAKKKKIKKKLESIFAADSSPKETKTCISIDEWIDVWGTIVGSAKRMDDFPMWLQYYPKVLFDIINRSGMFLNPLLRIHKSRFSTKSIMDCQLLHQIISGMKT